MSDKPVNKISLSVHKDGDFETCWQLQIDRFSQTLFFVKIGSIIVTRNNSTLNSFCYYSGKSSGKFSGFNVAFEPQWKQLKERFTLKLVHDTNFQKKTVYGIENSVQPVKRLFLHKRHNIEITI